MSHPVWVCGLKLARHVIEVSEVAVTPCMGVWIETSGGFFVSIGECVTPCMGVWIETLTGVSLTSCHQVTPCMGVWIETSVLLYNLVLRASHPVWVCGLKLPFSNTIKISTKSHPVWVCGLKLDEQGTPCLIPESHPVWVCGLKLLGLLCLFLLLRHTLYGCVD